MANQVYPKGMEHLAKGDWNWQSSDIRVVLLDLSQYTFNAGHEFLSVIPSGARIATSDPLTGKTMTNGVLDAVDPVIPSATGANVTGIAFVAYTGIAATSYLIAYVDREDDGTTPLNLPLDGSNVVVKLSDGTSKVMVV